MFTHVVKGDEDLDGEPLDQTQAEPLKVVHLDEVVEVDAEQFESQDEMLAENEMIKAFHNILLIFWIVLIQSGDQLRFNQTLLIQPSLVL